MTVHQKGQNRIYKVNFLNRRGKTTHLNITVFHLQILIKEINLRISSGTRVKFKLGHLNITDTTNSFLGQKSCFLEPTFIEIPQLK